MAPSRGPLTSATRLAPLRRPHIPVRLGAARPLHSAFHTSASHSSSIIETSITLAHSGITGLQSSLSLPWYLTLPLTALLIRSTLILPLQILAQRNRSARAGLTPAVLAARPALERMVIDKHNHLGPEKCTRLLAFALAKKRTELRKAAGIPAWPLWAPWAQFPVWLLAVETVRRMAGAGHGLLGMLGRREDGGAQVVGGEEGEGAATLTGGVGDGLFVPELAHGGALWFPDLLVPDPALVLPFALSGIMYASVVLDERLVDAAGVRRPRWSVALMRGVKLVALAVGPLTLNVPAAVMVYWVSSAATGLVQKAVVDRLVPIERSWVAEADRLNRSRPEPGLVNGPPGGGQPVQRASKYRPIRTQMKKR